MLAKLVTSLNIVIDERCLLILCDLPIDAMLLIKLQQQASVNSINHKVNEGRVMEFAIFEHLVILHYHIVSRLIVLDIHC